MGISFDDYTPYSYRATYGFRESDSDPPVVGPKLSLGELRRTFLNWAAEHEEFEEDMRRHAGDYSNEYYRAKNDVSFNYAMKQLLNAPGFRDLEKQCAIHADSEITPRAIRRITILLQVRHHLTAEQADRLSLEEAVKLLEFTPPATNQAGRQPAQDSPSQPIAVEFTTSQVISVTAWSHLRIGLDERRVPYAFLDSPEIGAQVRLKDGLELHLKGARWEVVLDLASASTDGRTLVAKEFIQETQSWEKPAKWLTDTLADLRRKLRERVKGPDDGAASLLVKNGTNIDLGFIVRALCRAEDGSYTFGSP